MLFAETRDCARFVIVTLADPKAPADRVIRAHLTLVESAKRANITVQQAFDMVLALAEIEGEISG